ncbi:MAG TPA: SDR family NAD(P)-dependent oxidoreductase, partial [Caldimonas sp.]|nr:SDR family NAD(P)-dependent oxidoreductase [Caldimonas sp.]
MVVGGTSGIGRALALGFARAGAHVVATGRRQSHVESVAAEIEGLGRRTLRQTSDVTDAASLGGLREACLSAFGVVDIVVAAAGITKRVPTVDMADADWEAILDTNLTGMMRTYRTFAPPMIQRGQGRLIGIASLGSY